MSKKTAQKTHKSKLPTWNLSLLYSSPKDERIEKDMVELEQACADFASKYDIQVKPYLTDESALLQILTDYEKLATLTESKPLVYFHFLRDIEASNKAAAQNMVLLGQRLAKCENLLTFFKVSLGSIAPDKQKEFLASPDLAHFKVFLRRIFDDAKYRLSVAEERIITLKSQPAHDNWISGNQKMLNLKAVIWQGKNIPLSVAMAFIPETPSPARRAKLAALVSSALKGVSPFSEAEINAIVLDKKIEDELRGFDEPEEETIRNYRNDPVVVKKLVDAVTKNFNLAHRFYKIKAKLLKLKKLSYWDRSVKIGKVGGKFSFERSMSLFGEVAGKLNPRYSQILRDYLAKGQIDVPPRLGKKSGAYCAGFYAHPTFVLLNHTDDFNSYSTLAHELGHAFHSELSKAHGPIYCDYSTALAETASTLFEALGEEAVYASLSEKEKIIALHDKINGDIQTIFRQIACFNFEKEIHETIRNKGFMTHEELSSAHNRHMQAYLGPVFKLTPDDGYFFVTWGHIRRFFYVYSYAYGLLVSKALLRRYRADHSFWSKIELFLSAGGKDSPENILKEIEIDPASPGFFEEGIREIEDDIEKLEEMVKKMRK